MNPQGILFVVLVSLLITVLLVSYIGIYMALLFHHSPIIFYIYFPIYILTALLLFVSYYRAACSSPGYTEEQDNEEFRQLEIEGFKGNAVRHKERKEKKKPVLFGADAQQIEQLKEHSFCERCNAVKPPRAHHCKACQRCILRMDHHCPWVGNCVGLQNHKYFILFLFYATLGLIMTWSTILIDANNNWQLISTSQQQEIAEYFMIGNGFISFFLSISIGFLLVTQLIGVFDNVTTIQSFVPGINQALPFKKDTAYENFTQIFGQSLWMLPVSPNLNRKY